MPLTFTVLRCPDTVAPETRALAGGEFTVGRGPGVDWLLPDPERLLSKHHFAVAYRGGAWQIADTSTNGTFLNTDADPIGRGQLRTLRDGDRVKLGAYEIEVRLTEDAVQPAGGRSFGVGGSAAASPFGDPFGTDPFALPPPSPAPFGAPLYPAASSAGSAQLPPDFDPLAPDAEEEPFRGATQPDHSQLLEDAFRAPSVTGQMPLHSGGALPGDDLLPDDWDKDLLEGIAAPVSPVAPMQPVQRAQPGSWEQPAQPAQPVQREQPGSWRPVAEPFAPSEAPPSSRAGAAPPPGTPSPRNGPPQGLPPQGLPPQGTPPQGLPPQGAPLQGLPPLAADPPTGLAAGNPFEEPFDLTPPAAADSPSGAADAQASSPFPASLERGQTSVASAFAPAAPAAAPAAAGYGAPAGAPPHAAATAPNAAQSSNAVGASADVTLLAAFLDGAGLSDARLADPGATMHALGEAFRTMVAGLRAVLIARASVKNEFRIEQTMIQARGNNPLKFSAGDDDALAALLGAGRRIDMTAAAAVADALKDIRLHELASMAAMQAAVRALLEGLDPVRLRAQAEQAGGLSVLPAQRKARAWDAYEALYASTVQALSDDFDSIFGKAFARAYEQAMQDVSAKERR